MMMCVCWMVASFGYFLINFYQKYIEGDVFLNNAMGSIAEPIAYIGSSLLLRWVPMKKLFISSFLISYVFVLTVISSEQWVITLAVFLAKLGNASAFNLAFLANSELFPSLYRSTCFGVCNFVARLVTILSPMIAETSNPYPALIFSIASGVATASSFVLKFPKTAKEELRLVGDKKLIDL